MAKRSRDKGKVGERECAEIWRQAGFSVERTAPLQADAASERGDLEVSGFGRVEVKRRATGYRTIYAQLADTHALCLRADRHDWLIVMRLDDFLQRERG